MRRSSKLLVVFWDVFLTLKTVCCIVFFLVIIEIYNICHFWTTKNIGLKSVDARNVGAYPEDAKQKMRKTCLKNSHGQRWSLPAFFYLGLNQRLLSFLKELIEVRLFWSFVSIKLNILKMLKVKRLIVNFLLLVLGILSNKTLSDIYKSLWVT